MQEFGNRTTHPCDGCAWRRVRCEGGQPCRQCSHRSISCTFLKPRKKRGPKGLQKKTGLKISLYQQSLLQQTPEDITDSAINTPDTLGHHDDSDLRLPLSAFVKVLDVFQKQLYSVWPIVSCENLITSLQKDTSDHESFALASAICAASIAQLRLLEHSVEHDLYSDTRFEQEAQYYRSTFDYRGIGKVSCILTAFFLHIFWANNGDFRRAEWYLKEAVMCALPFASLSIAAESDENKEDYELRLRIYWILFVTERTYCVEHNCQAILEPIEALPQAYTGADPDSIPIPGLLALAQSFTFLHKDIIRSNIKGCGSPTSKLTSVMVSSMQRRLSDTEFVEHGLDEVQKIDLVVTRNWIRALLWQYTIANFLVYRQSEDEAFSSYLPERIAWNLSDCLSSPAPDALRAHGYGMELKIFKVADLLLDISACHRAFDHPQSMCYGSRDLICYLENIILTVGGPKSDFLKSLRSRMASLQLELPSSWQSNLDLDGQEQPKRQTDCHRTNTMTVVDSCG